VIGNHDHYCGLTFALDGFNDRAAEDVRWTRQQLNNDDRQWLESLPLKLTISGFTVVHGSLNQPKLWEYVFDKHAAASSFAKQTTSVCFFGHTHVPVAFIRDSVVRGGTFNSIQIQPDCSYFINVGSVGQPRDGIKKPAYVTYDLDSRLVELRRLEASL
jgi:diadenosine tetraphosphatase ApaH/serine/threonine PP2A family protein phosphatase